MVQKNSVPDKSHNELLKDDVVMSSVAGEIIQVSISDELYLRLKETAENYFVNVADFHKAMTRHYLKEKPWTHTGWEWLAATPKSQYRYSGGISTPTKTGLIQYDITLPADVTQRLRAAYAEVQAEDSQISLESFLSTMLFKMTRDLSWLEELRLQREMLEDEAALLRIQHEATKAAHEAAMSAVDTETVQTRARDELHSYIKAVAGYYFGSMTGFHKVIAKYYLEEKPWTRPGWAWLFPKSTYSYAGGVSTVKGGWRQYNITMPVDIAQQIRAAHAEVQAGNPQISLASFLYTMLIWGVANYFPPKKRGIEGAKETEHVSRNLLG